MWNIYSGIALGRVAPSIEGGSLPAVSHTPVCHGLARAWGGHSLRSRRLCPLGKGPLGGVARSDRVLPSGWVLWLARPGAFGRNKRIQNREPNERSSILSLDGPEGFGSDPAGLRARRHTFLDGRRGHKTPSSMLAHWI